MLVDIVLHPGDETGTKLIFGFAADFINDYIAAVPDEKKQRFLATQHEALASGQSSIFSQAWPWPAQEHLACQVRHAHGKNCPLCGGQTVIKRAKADELAELMSFIHEIYLWHDTHESALKIRHNQSFDFSDRSGGIGHLYAPLLGFIRNAPSEVLRELSSSVESWMRKAHLQIYGYDEEDMCVHLFRSGIYLGLADGSARSFHVSAFKEGDASARIEPHHVDNIQDEFILMTGIIAINTFFRRTKQSTT